MQWLLELSIRRKLYLIIGLPIFNVALIIFLGMFAQSELGETSRWTARVFLWLMIGGSLFIGVLSVAIAISASRALRGAVRLREEFLSIASHELRTPITSMRMQLQLAQRQPTPERLEKMLDVFGLQTARLNKLVEDLLDVSRIQSGHLSISTEICNLSEILKRSLERLSVNLQNARCSLDLDINDSVTGSWDRRRIEQVFTNLMTNAIKYAPGGIVRISLRQKTDFVVFRIQDSGPGIALEKQWQIFERFERAITSRNVSGLGLGLFIAKKIVAEHGGTIRVSSEKGKGATFTVELPRVNAGVSAEGAFQWN